VASDLIGAAVDVAEMVAGAGDMVSGLDRRATTGVLVMAYGTPATPADVEAYYTHVRRGRPPTPEQLADLQRRYDAIGGTSPLLEVTQAQADGLAAALGKGWEVELGMKHAPPFIEDGVTALAGRGVRRVVGLVLAPHYSALSVGEYAGRIRATDSVATNGVELVMVESWHLTPGYLNLLARRVIVARAGLGDVDPVRLRPPRDPVRPRRGGHGCRGRPGPGLRPHRVAERRPRLRRNLGRGGQVPAGHRRRSIGKDPGCLTPPDHR